MTDAAFSKADYRRFTFFTRSEERKYNVTYFDACTCIYMYNAMNNNIELLGRGPSRSMGHGQYGWEGLGGWGIGCQWLAGLVLGVVFKTASSDDSGGRVVGLLCVEP